VPLWAPSSSRLTFAYDLGHGIAVDAAGSAYVTGYTGSSDFPTRDPFQAAFGGALYDAFVTKLTSVIAVTIDVKPGSDTNPINASSQGLIPVAILSTDSFDATTVDAGSVCFGDAEDASQRDCTEAHGTGHLEDVNGDGRLDLVLHFEVQETGIDPGDTSACLSGTTLDGTPIEGCEASTVV
jgi:hypothetical protein